MKAAFNLRYGKPRKVIEVGEFSKPSPGTGEILIRVYSSSVNRTDCGFLLAKPWIVRFFSGLFIPKTKVLGCEFAGEVVGVGEGVTKFKVGDRVFGFDDETFGGHGEFMVINENKMITKMPDNVDYETAGVATEGSHYCLEYIRVSGVAKGSKVFVNGGTGAIGSAAIQILKSMGVEVDSTARAEHIDLVKSLGANQVYDYEKINYKEIEGQYDLFFDSVGKTSFMETKHLLKPGGVFSASEFGPWFSNIWLTLWTKVFGGVGGKNVQFPLPRNSVEDLEYIASLLESGEFKPVMDRKYKLEEIIEAYEYVLTGKKVGNVVVEVDIEK